MSLFLEDENLLKEMLAEVSAEELSETMNALTVEIGPRHAGTPEEETAVQHMKKLLESYGIETEILRWPSYLVVPKLARLKVLSPVELDIQCSPDRQNVTSPTEGIEGEVVYMLTEDIGLVDCRDKIVLLETVSDKRVGINPAKFRKLEDMGAKAIIVISQDKVVPTIIHHRGDFSVSGNPTPENIHKIHKISAVVQVTYTDGQKLKRLVENGPTSIWVKSEIEAGWKTLPMLTAEIKAGVETEKFILIEGHMDTTLASPGVTDNSSGNAACIELARIFNKFREKLRRNVKIAFWTSHETGRYSGSTWYNDVFWHDLRYNCIMSLCIEGPGAKGAYKWRNVTANELADHAIRCAKEVLGAEIGAGPGIGSRKSDGSFWGTGFPKCSIDSMQLPETADPFGSGSSCNWWWHTPWATIDKYDLNLLVETAKYYVRFLFNILNDPILPMSFRRAIDAQLGFIERIQDEIEKISAHFNLNSLLDRMKEFRVQSDLLDETVNEILEKYKNASNDETFIPILEKLNNCFMWVGRHVNIVSHWNAKKTGQISMEEIGSQAYPSLIGGEGVPGVLDLGRMAFPTYGPKPDFYMLRTKLIRERNWVEDGYYLAIQTIKKTLRELKDMSENQKLACACGVIF